MAVPKARGSEATLLFAWNFSTVMAIALARIVRSALFQAHVGADHLPTMYVLSPLAVTLTGLLHARIAAHVRRATLAWVTPLVLATLLAAAWHALGARWVYFALYAGVEVMVSLLMIQFWSSAGERFSSREAREVFSRIATGGTIANILIGVAVKLLVRRTGTAAWLLVCVVCLVSASCLAFALDQRFRTAAPARPAQRILRDAPKDPPGTRHLRLLTPIITCSVLVTTLLEFQFNEIGRRSFGDSDEAWSEFHGWLQITTGVFALGVQRFVTNRLLRHSGIAGALLLLPLTMGASALGILVTPSLLPATISELGDILRFTVYDAAYQLVYLPVPAAVRARRKSTIDGVLKPSTEMLSGVALQGYNHVVARLAPLASLGLRLRPLAGITTAAVALWIVSIFRLRTAFAQSLAETLRQRRIVSGDPDDVVSRDLQRALHAALRTGDLKAIRNALDLAAMTPGALGDDLRALAAHPDATVRAQALAGLAAGDLPVDDATLREALGDSDPGVQAAGALVARGTQIAGVLPLLDAGVPAVAAAAAEGLYRHGDPSQREKVIARVARLLKDPSAEVRRQAMHVARRVGDPALAPAVIVRLSDRREQRAAVEALAAMGPVVEEKVIEAMGEPLRAAGAVRALGRLGTPTAITRVVEALKDSDEGVRDAAAAALENSWAGHGLSDEPMVTACAHELTMAYEAMAAAEGLGRAESTLMPDGTRRDVPYRPETAEGPAALISRALRERSDRARTRLFHLMAAMEPGMQLPTILDNLDSPEALRRTNAVELLDARPWHGAMARLKPLVITLVDETPRGLKVLTAAREFKLPAKTRDRWVETLLGDPNPWMAACAAYYAGATEVLSARTKLRALCDRTEGVLAETARAALARMDDTATTDETMITTAQKVLFLKGIELFAAVPSEDLVEVAGIATEVYTEASELVFREGDPGDGLYFVVEGTVRVTQGGRTLAELKAREVFGEMALLDPAPRSATAVAVTPVTLLRVAQDDFTFILRERPEVSLGVLRVLTRRLRAANLAQRAEDG